jgi:hypothetical protein
VSLSELAACVCDEATRFWAAHPLDPSDSARGDFERAHQRLKRTL